MLEWLPRAIRLASDGISLNAIAFLAFAFSAALKDALQLC
jgi:hypothetical protein